MSITYCKSWSRAYKEPVELWSKERAKLAHEKRSRYGVLVGDANAPCCFIDISGDYIGVGFLDEKLRETLSYQFHEIEPGKVFLVMASYRDFDGNSDRVLSGSTYYFSVDGSIKIEKQDLSTGEIIRSELKGDVSGNYDKYPGFGCYDHLIRPER